MENNSDKLLRDKLKSMEFPYEAKAWQEMENMLDEKKERKGFFMWWFGAALLFIALLVIGYNYFQFHAQPVELANRKETPKVQGTLNTASATQPATQLNPSTTHIQNGALALGSGNNKIEHAANKNNLTKAAKNKAGLNKSSQNNYNYNTKNGFASIGENKAESDNPTINKSATSFSFSDVEIMKIDQLDGEEQTKEIIMIRADEDAVEVRKIKNKTINYSLGVIANVTGTTLGNQHPGFFYNIPTYAVGLTHQLTFKNRIAITSAIEFSKTAFFVNRPSAPDLGVIPENYTSKITEIDIPIGIKVYAISKKKFRFYLQAGIINHIKLKETFHYSTAASFNAAGNFSNQFLDASSSPGVTDFSINKASRYYASFYSSAGIEFMAQKHWVFFAEPLFYMSLEKIGVQNKTKYNTGLSGGFRYQI